MARLWILLLFFYLVVWSTQAQDTIPTVRVELITTDDGLPQGLVWSIIQDRDGFLWVATKDGLVRHDGYDFKVFRHDPLDLRSIAANHITALFEDSHGFIWVGFEDKGLDRYNPETGNFTHVELGEEINEVSSILSIREHPNGYIWVHAHFTELFYVRNALQKKQHDLSRANEPEELTLRDARLMFPALDVPELREMHIDDQGCFWLLCQDSLFISAPSAPFSVISDSWLLESKWQRTEYRSGLLSYGKQQRMLMILDEHLVVFDAIERAPVDTFILPAKQLFGSNMLIDPEDRLWGAGPEGSWFRMSLSSGEIDFLKPSLAWKSTLPGNGFFTWCMDRSGTVWAGTPGYGLVKYLPRSESFHNITSDKHGIEYTEVFRTDLQGKELLNAREFRRLTEGDDFLNPIGFNEALAAKGLRPGWERCVKDPKGRYWATAYSGPGSTPRPLYCYEPTEDELRRMSFGSGEFFINVFPGRGDEIWVLSANNTTEEDDSLFCYNTRKESFTGGYAFPGPVKSGTKRGVSAWHINGNGTLVMGTSFGVYTLDPATGDWQSFRHDKENVNSITSDLVFSICPDPDSPDVHYWIGTGDNGLCRMDIRNGFCDQFRSTGNGLPNDVIYSIMNDSTGDLWFASNQGLCKWNPDTDALSHFTVKDGLVGNEFNRYSAAEREDGYMFFGGMEGITWFDPNKAIPAASSAPTRITAIKLMNETIDKFSRPDILSGPAHRIREITLPYHERMVTFSFAYMDMSVPYGNQFRYRLDGFNTDWVNAGTEHVATFTNLDPGYYSFKVQGRSNAGPWTAGTATLQITVIPPWWETWWFLSGMVLLLGGLVYWLYRYRLNKELEVVRIREGIARDLHDEIGSTLSSLAMFSTVARSQVGMKIPMASKMLDRITDNTTGMMEAMNDIVWSVNQVDKDNAQLVQRMRSFALGLSESNGVQLEMDVSEAFVNVDLSMLQRKNLLMVFKEALNNSMKYAECEHVIISLNLKAADTVYLIVEDDGVGFEPNESGLDRSGGNGIPNMQKRAQQLGGHLAVRSKRGHGTSITFQFNLNS